MIRSSIFFSRRGFLERSSLFPSEPLICYGIYHAISFAVEDSLSISSLSLTLWLRSVRWDVGQRQTHSSSDIAFGDQPRSYPSPARFILSKLSHEAWLKTGSNFLPHIQEDSTSLPFGSSCSGLEVDRETLSKIYTT